MFLDPQAICPPRKSQLSVRQGRRKLRNRIALVPSSLLRRRPMFASFLSISFGPLTL